MINRVLTKINGFVTLGAVHHLVGSIATVPHSTTSTELNSEGGLYPGGYVDDAMQDKNNQTIWWWYRLSSECLF